MLIHSDTPTESKFVYLMFILNRFDDLNLVNDLNWINVLDWPDDQNQVEISIWLRLTPFLSFPSFCPSIYPFLPYFSFLSIPFYDALLFLINKNEKAFF